MIVDLLIQIQQNRSNRGSLFILPLHGDTTFWEDITSTKYIISTMSIVYSCNRFLIKFISGMTRTNVVTILGFWFTYK